MYKTGGATNAKVSQPLSSPATAGSRNTTDWGEDKQNTSCRLKKEKENGKVT